MPEAAGASSKAADKNDKGHNHAQQQQHHHHHDGGHHCILPLFVLFLIGALLVLQVSKVERLHKVSP